MDIGSPCPLRQQYYTSREASLKVGFDGYYGSGRKEHTHRGMSTTQVISIQSRPSSEILRQEATQANPTTIPYLGQLDVLVNRTLGQKEKQVNKPQRDAKEVSSYPTTYIISCCITQRRLCVLTINMYDVVTSRTAQYPHLLLVMK